MTTEESREALHNIRSLMERKFGITELNLEKTYEDPIHMYRLYGTDIDGQEFYIQKAISEEYICEEKYLLDAMTSELTSFLQEKRGDQRRRSEMASLEDLQIAYTAGGNYRYQIFHELSPITVGTTNSIYIDPPHTVVDNYYYQSPYTTGDYRWEWTLKPEESNGIEKGRRDIGIILFEKDNKEIRDIG